MRGFRLVVVLLFRFLYQGDRQSVSIPRGAHSFRDSYNLENAFEFGVAEEGNFQSAFALGVTQTDFGAQTFAQLVFEAGHVGFRSLRSSRGGFSSGFPSLQAGNKSLGLPHVEAVLEDALGGECLLFLAVQAEDDFGMAHGNAALPQISLQAGRQFQQAQRVGDDCAALTHLGGGFLLGELELPDELGITLGLLDGVKVFALQVFDEGQLEHRAVIGLTNDHGDLAQAQQLGRAPAAFTGNKFQMAVALADNQGLNDALFPDRIGQLAERLRRKVLARLKRAGADTVQRHALNLLACHGWRGRD
ncbi:hypothetical protein SBV1_620025 [Verrucomicrobia bacterium]|nr:hypothetical protein SBV1_620025 [Verrucomicrobiota bacterium]